MSGFARELFLEAVEEEFICSICHGVFNRPVTCQDGHSFCKECITHWQAERSHCPVDRSPLTRPLTRNLVVEGIIGRRMMKCPSSLSHPGGCSWTGQSSSVGGHLPFCDMKVGECTFKERGCIVRAYQRELVQHLPMCPHRTVKCTSCSADVPHQDLSLHRELCTRRVVYCPNECGMQIERCKMLSHLAFVCVKEGRPCPLYAIGCPEVHTLGEANLSSYLNLLLNAHVSAACGVHSTSGGGISLAASWCLEGGISLPVCSPIFQGHAAVVRLEISNENGIVVKLYLESK